MVTEMCLPFSSIQWDWMFTERSPNSAWNPDFSEHSVSIRWTFRNVSVDWKENFHPVAMHIGAICSPFQLIASWHIEILNLFLISLNSYYIDALKFIFFSELSNSVVFLQRKQSSNEGTEEGIDLQQRYPCLGSHIKLKNFAKGFHVHQCKKKPACLAQHLRIFSDK